MYACTSALSLLSFFHLSILSLSLFPFPFHVSACPYGLGREPSSRVAPGAFNQYRPSVPRFRGLASPPAGPASHVPCLPRGGMRLQAHCRVTLECTYTSYWSPCSGCYMCRAIGTRIVAQVRAKTRPHRLFSGQGIAATTTRTARQQKGPAAPFVYAQGGHDDEEEEPKP